MRVVIIRVSQHARRRALSESDTRRALKVHLEQCTSGPPLCTRTTTYPYSPEKCMNLFLWRVMHCYIVCVIFYFRYCEKILNVWISCSLRCRIFVNGFVVLLQITYLNWKDCFDKRLAKHSTLYLLSRCGTFTNTQAWIYHKGHGVSTCGLRSPRFTVPGHW